MEVMACRYIRNHAKFQVAEVMEVRDRGTPGPEGYSLAPGSLGGLGASCCFEAGYLSQAIGENPVFILFSLK